MVIKAIYKTLRSVIFTVTLLVVGLYVLIYVLFSIPVFTNRIKDIATDQLSAFLGGKVEIEELKVYPFNEVNITGLKLYDPKGEKCLEVEELGAGISVWKFLSQRRIEITYGEIIGLNALVRQEEKDGPLNISFLIEALSSKDKNKEKKPFELGLRNVVLRKSALKFERQWLSGTFIGSIDQGDLSVINLAADISFPKISDKGVEVDLRRLSMTVTGATEIEKIGFKGEFGPKLIQASNISVELPNSAIHIPQIRLEIPDDGNIQEALTNGDHQIEISDSWLTPSDFAFLWSPLKSYSEALPLEVKIKGNLDGMTIEKFDLGNSGLITLSFKGEGIGLRDLASAKGSIEELYLYLSPALTSGAGEFIPKISSDVVHMLHRLGALEISGEASGAIGNKSAKGHLNVNSDLFGISIEGEMDQSARGRINGIGEVTIDNLRLHEILPNIPVGNIDANIVAEGSIEEGKVNGMASLVVDNFDFKGKRYEGFSINVNKDGEKFDGDLLLHNAIADIEAKTQGDFQGEDKSLRLDMDIERLDLSEVIDMKKYEGYQISGTVNMDLALAGMNSVEGNLALNNFSFSSEEASKRLYLKQLLIQADRHDSIQNINLRSDWVDARAEGPYRIKDLPGQLKELAASVMPALLGAERTDRGDFLSDMDFDIVIKKNNMVPEFFNLPVRLLVPVTLSGSIDGTSNTASVILDMPFLQQGKDKLIYDTRFTAEIDGDSGFLNALIETNVPVKKGDLSLNVNLLAHNNAVNTDIHWINTENSDFKGHLILDTEFNKNPLTLTPEIYLQIKPSVLEMGTATWFLSQSDISYGDKLLDVKGLRISHEDQFVDIRGKASPEFEDVLTITLEDIDVDYVFDMLQINYVTFGGTATGEIIGRSLLSGNPVAETESLVIKDFTYNGCALGECKASSRWNNEEKEIEIAADIRQNGRQTVEASGGIWLGRDSLSFDIEAKKVPVDFVQPFMAVFSSHVGGFATGDVKLFGTFHDIDMTGKIFADSVAVKLDYTNTIYHGSDSVYLNPGQIEIPHFTLYDKYGNSALLTGELTHRYFHDPSFVFRLTDANNFLCYDTTQELNPDWYGTLYGTGSANLTGVPGLVDISADMSVSGNSNFTFVLNDTQYARDYQFLTFSDRRAEEKRSTEITVQDMKEMLKRQMHHDEGSLSLFGIDIRATVTPQTLFTLVMDPAAGDKITARGKGAMQVKYESDDDEMTMYGKYEIEEGNYNFSLQDIILRDFKIKEGSSISFNGNPLAADLDISATYRVNTNLSDLDKSFSTDRDLNRTNVPVDAVLSVTGDMTSPDITFDIELPTLTQDVERKVKSIISTDDMMNRQIIYLLALNRFYTPEYMGATGNGGELAAVASSTISSQLSNILGQLTDKFSVSPSFRSDKGDFSDIEVDVALSSRLLNNRLLINGNFGYRDRSNSSTTFVGDFDVEYLLTKNGNLRLKAYNHFNDQNYYLREALTTQGLGVVYRKDFDDWFTFLRKRRPNKETTEEEDGNKD